jgi:hypothetical protein
MGEAIAGFYRTRLEGAAAEKALLENGFRREEVSFMAGEDQKQTPAVGPVKEVGADTEAARDAWIGGVAGLAAGVIAVAIPGVGLLLAAGPLAAALGGLTAGAAAGGIIGLLKDHGISEEEAEFYSQGVSRGGALVTVRGVSDERAKQARQIMDDSGALQVENLQKNLTTG